MSEVIDKRQKAKGKHKVQEEKKAKSEMVKKREKVKGKRR